MLQALIVGNTACQEDSAFEGKSASFIAVLFVLRLDGVSTNFPRFGRSIATILRI